MKYLLKRTTVTSVRLEDTIFLKILSEKDVAAKFFNHVTLILTFFQK